MRKKLHILRLPVILLAIAAFLFYLRYTEGKQDVSAPVFTVAQELLELSVSAPEEALLQGITAHDPEDGDVTASILVENIYGIQKDGTVTVTYAAFDKSGNVSKYQRTVRYTDYRSPRFTLKTSLSFPAGDGYEITQLVGAQDSMEGDISRRIRVTLSGDSTGLDQVGTHQILLQVSNKLGDICRISLPIEIYKVGQYNAVLSLKDYILYLPKGGSFQPEQFLSTIYYGGRELLLEGELPENVHVETSGLVNRNVPGVYPISYTVTVDEGAYRYTGYARLLVVVEE